MAAATRDHAASVEGVEPQGLLFYECSLPGEQKKDGVMPAHPNGIQLSQDRFLLIYSTRGFRGRDDEWSTVYQLRAGGWTGEILRENYIAQTSNDWDALGDGRTFVRQLGHPVGFGVPKGALIDGKRVPHENHFVLMWRVVAREIDRETGHVYWTDRNPEVLKRSAHARWLQFRLNDQEDDIEITIPERPFRQKGFETGEALCSEETVHHLIKGFVCPIPFNADCTEWVDINTVNGNSGEGLSESKKTARIMPAKYRWNPQTASYDWVECGSPIGPDLFEGSIARFRDEFVVCARMPGFSDKEYSEGKPTKLVAWSRTKDPFAAPVEMTKPATQPNWHPLTIYQGPDGSIWRLGTCVAEFGWFNGRHPLAMMRIDPDRDFLEVERLKVFSTEDPLAPQLGAGHPNYDFAKLLPHTGGREQIVLHRMTTTDVWRKPEQKDWKPNGQNVDVCGIYWEKVIYGEDLPPYWKFSNTKE